MKKLLLISIVFTLLVSCNSKKTNNDAVNEVDAPEAGMDMAPEAIIPCSEDLGVLKWGKEGYTISKDNERTLMVKLLKYDSCKLIRIQYATDLGDMKVTYTLEYDRSEQVVRNKSSIGKIVEEIRGITPGALISFLEAGGVYWPQLAKANGTQVVAIEPQPLGMKPDQNVSDGSVEIVKEFILHGDVERVKFLEWSPVWAKDESWAVRCKYNSMNADGGVVANDKVFLIQYNKVVDLRDYVEE